MNTKELLDMVDAVLEGEIIGGASHFTKGGKAMKAGKKLAGRAAKKAADVAGHPLTGVAATYAASGYASYHRKKFKTAKTDAARTHHAKRATAGTAVAIGAAGSVVARGLHGLHKAKKALRNSKESPMSNLNRLNEALDEGLLAAPVRSVGNAVSKFVGKKVVKTADKVITKASGAAVKKVARKAIGSPPPEENTLARLQREAKLLELDVQGVGASMAKKLAPAVAGAKKLGYKAATSAIKKPAAHLAAAAGTYAAGHVIQKSSSSKTGKNVGGALKTAGVAHAAGVGALHAGIGIGYNAAKRR